MSREPGVVASVRVPLASVAKSDATVVGRVHDVSIAEWTALAPSPVHQGRGPGAERSHDRRILRRRRHRVYQARASLIDSTTLPYLTNMPHWWAPASAPMPSPRAPPR